LLVFIKAKEWPLVTEEPFTVGKQKGGASSSRSYTAMLRSVDRDNEKSEGIKTVSMTSLNLGVSGSAAVAFHSVAVKKKIETLPVTPVNLFPTVLASMNLGSLVRWRLLLSAQQRRR